MAKWVDVPESGRWRDVDTDDSSSKSSFLGDYANQAIGGLVGAGDFLGAIPGIFAAGVSVLAPPENEFKGDSWEDVGKRAQKAMHSFMPSTYLGKYLNTEQKRGLEAAHEIAMIPLEQGAKGLKGASLLGVPPLAKGIAIARKALSSLVDERKLTPEELKYYRNKVAMLEDSISEPMYGERFREFATEMMSKPETSPTWSAAMETLGMFPGYAAANAGIGAGIRGIRGEKPLPAYGTTGVGKKPAVEPTVSETEVFDPRYEPILNEAGERVGQKRKGTRIEPKWVEEQAIDIVGGKKEGAWRDVEVTDRIQEPLLEPPEVTAQREAMHRVGEELQAKENRESVVDPLGHKPFMAEPEPYVRDTIYKDEAGNEHPIDIPWEAAEKTRLVAEKQGKEGPVEDPRGYFNLDDQRIPNIQNNPHALAREPITYPNTLEIVSGMLEERALPVEKAIKNRTLNSLSKQVDEQGRYVESMLDKREPVSEIQKEIEVWEELVVRTENKINEIERNANKGRSTENTLKKTYPQATQHPFSKKQGGGIRIDQISEGFRKIRERWGRAIEEFNTPREGALPQNEGMIDQIKRSVEAYKDDPTPAVWRDPNRPINKGPGGSQRGAFSLEPLDDFLKKIKLIGSGFNQVPKKAAVEWIEHEKERLAHNSVYANRKDLFDEYGRIISDKAADEFIKTKERALSSSNIEQQARDNFIDALADQNARLGIGIPQPKYPFNKGPGGKQSGSVDLNVMGEEFKKLRTWITKKYNTPEYLKDPKTNEPVLVFRGQNMHGGTGSGQLTVEHAKQRRLNTGINQTEPYSVFTTENPYLASAYTHHLDDGVVYPFVLKNAKIIEFPVSKSGDFNKFAFDRQARQLKKGEILVARGGYDIGPHSGWDFPKNRHTYKADQYAINDPSLLHHIFDEPTGAIKSPGNKQGGTVDPQVFIEGLRKGSKSVEEFTKKLVDELGEGMRPIASTLYNKDKAKEGEYIPASTDKKVISRAGKEVNRYSIYDNRTPEQFIKEELPNADKWEDPKQIPRNFGLITNLIPGSSIASLAREMPVINWLVSRALTHAREARVLKENAKHGSLFAPKRGLGKAAWDRRLQSDDGAVTIFKRMSLEDVEAAKNLWLEKYDGKLDPTMESLRKDGMNETQAKAIMAARNQYDIMLKMINDEAAKHGIAPIKRIPGYFMHLWDGDYRIIAKQKTIGPEGGISWETMWIEGAKTEKEARIISEDLQAKFPDYEIKFSEARSKYDLGDTKAFKEAINILDKQDPAREILQRAFNDILSHRGFQTHTLFRKGVPGFLGAKNGKQGVKDFISALEESFDKGYNFLANQRKKTDLGEMQRKLKENNIDIDSRFPNSAEYMKAYIDNSTDGVKSGMMAVDRAVEMVGSKTGVGKSAGRNALATINGTASAWWLTTPRFVFAQLMQPLYNIPQAFKLKAQGFTDKSVTMSFMQAYKEAFTSPSKKTIEGMNWAKRNGIIDSKIVELMGAKFDKPGHVMATAFNTFSKYSLGKIEQEAVRTPSFIFYDLLLRDSIKNDKERWQIAGALTDKYMIDYTQTDAPLAYGKLGIVGEGVRPLKQFSHGYYGQLLEHAQAIKYEKDPRPLGTFLGIQALMGGAKGFILIAEANLIINTLNQIPGVNIPTVDEWLATSGVSDTFMFGGVSKFTGMDVSSTMGAPQVGQMATAPGLAFGIEAAKNVGNLAYQYDVDPNKDMRTTQDKMKALQSITPNVGQLAVEEAFSKPGEGPPNPNNRMIPDIGERTLEDKFYRAMGGRSIKEARETHQVRAFKRADTKREKSLKHSMDVILDRHLEDGDIPDHIIDKWINSGGNPKRLPDAIVKYYKDKARTFAERHIGTMKGLDGAQRAQKLQEFDLLLEEAEGKDMLEILRGLK